MKETLLSLSLLLIIGCEEAPENTAKKTILKKETFGKKWAFNVDSVELECNDFGNGINAPTVKVGDNIYGLTGFAKQKFGTAELDDIWRDNTELKGTKIDISTFSKLCDN